MVVEPVNVAVVVVVLVVVEMVNKEDLSEFKLEFVVKLGALGMEFECICVCDGVWEWLWLKGILFILCITPRLPLPLLS